MTFKILKSCKSQITMRFTALLCVVGLALCSAMPAEREMVSGAVSEMSGLLGADDTDVVQQAFDSKRQATLNLPKELAALEHDAESVDEGQPADIGEADLSLKVDKTEVNNAVDQWKKTGKMPKLNTKEDRLIAADHSPQQIELSEAIRDAKHTEVRDVKAMDSLSKTLDHKHDADVMEKKEVGGVLAQAKAALAASAALNNQEESEEELGESKHESYQEAAQEALKESAALDEEESEEELGEDNEEHSKETPEEKKLDAMAMTYKKQEKKTMKALDKDEKTYVKNVKAQKQIDTELAAVKTEAKEGLEMNAKVGSTDELGESVEVGDEMDGLADMLNNADKVLNDDKDAHKAAQVLSDALDEHGDDLIQMGMNAISEALF